MNRQTDYPDPQKPLAQDSTPAQTDVQQSAAAQAELAENAAGENTLSENAAGEDAVAEDTATKDAAVSAGTSRRRGRFEKPRKKRRFARIVLIILCVLVGIVIALVLTYLILHQLGKQSMLGVYDNIVLDLPQQSGEVLSINDGKTVSYQGRSYQLNENIATILFLGVDKRQFTEVEYAGKGGQADCILLIAMDTNTGKTTILNISRDSYAQVDVYSGSNRLIGTQNLQLCLAYSYGDGKEQSCERTINSVSRILYNMPIGAYVALDETGISAANDSIGGVTLTSLDEIPLTNGKTLHTGEEITLLGQDAERYIRTRDTGELDSNQARMERQKQYVQAFAAIVTQKAKKDIGVPVDLYSTLKQYLVSSLTTADVAFLSTCYIENGANLTFRSISGTVDKLNGSAVYYLDDTSVYETVLDVFYTPLGED